MQEIDWTDQLTFQQMKAIRVLLSKGDITSTVRIVGCSRQTLYNWINKDVAFRGILKQHSHAVLDQVSRSLITAAENAVTLLSTTVDNPKATMTHRLRAADSILSHVIKLMALADIENRLAVLEALDEKDMSNVQL